MALAAFGVAIVVGLTGMGGGALMTPMLVLFFGVPPLTAVSSDLVASAVMKPIGSVVHLRRKTVNLEVVKWLAVGSVPSAFAGVLVLKWLGSAEKVQQGVKLALGIALMLSAILLVVRAYIRLVERARSADGRGSKLPQARPGMKVRMLPTILLGVAGGAVVGMTSVGSGSIIIIGLMMIYPGLKANQLVGTDLVQAVPLVAAAALGHTFFGDLNLALTLPLVLGSIPGVYLGARLSSRLSGGFVRRALAFVLLASALKMLAVPDAATGIILAVGLLAAPLLWMYIRRQNGLPALASTESRQRRNAIPYPQPNKEVDGAV
ncbi:sulfite exporter TauE/SafE family protein [Paenarthrobacter sp. Z7-10]|uniref:sulfite exporter TauE/SafE family protein n=1 Tax=Paenarthrobacter sp. Z7-10 TaxID=2787635 RepID=UPI0022A9217B|nr:sulfite exporter TauE/SafE family protein [Paenarthrobacter sp. Z7-10]